MTTQAIKDERLHEFMMQIVGDMGAAAGDRLGLSKAMDGVGPLTAEQPAEKTGAHVRSVREWLNAQAAVGYITYDPEAQTLHAASRAGDGPGERGQPGLHGGRMGSGGIDVGDERQDRRCVGAVMGAQAGEARHQEMFNEAGFGRFRRATETPFNLILEARP